MKHTLTINTGHSIHRMKVASLPAANQTVDDIYGRENIIREFGRCHDNGDFTDHWTVRDPITGNLHLIEMSDA